MAWDPWDDLDQGRFSVELRPWLSGSAGFVSQSGCGFFRVQRPKNEDH